jgi:hypothetical protein
MELILNIAWGLLAVISFYLWIQAEHRSGTDRRLQIVALLMLIVVLFPVISVSDDLWSIQNPAETDTLQRRDHLASPAQSIFPALATICEPFFAAMRFGFLNSPRPAISQVFVFASPTPVRILNRPPPAA